jgi:hypothetical protein
VPLDGAVLVGTRLMTGVRVDPAAGTAWVAAGARWQDVLEHTTPYGLAPLNGSNPGVGAVGYTTGGGAGLLGRRYGFAADHVRRLRVVTADGRVREVSPDHDPDLFWAIRGAKDSFGIVTGMEIDLFPVSRLYGGGLYFPGEAVGEVLHGYAAWTPGLPAEMATSVLLSTYPDLPGVPGPLRGRPVAHVRVAYSGDPAGGELWVEPLRHLGVPLLDTVREMPYADVGAIHHEPTAEPYAAYDRNLLLRELTADTVDEIVSLAGPGAAFITELRQFGGAYARPPAVPNAVGGRDAAFSVYTGAAEPGLEGRDLLLSRLRPWSTGGMNLNFMGVEDAGHAAEAFAPADLGRLRELKARHDPDDLFRCGFTVTAPSRLPSR